MALIIEDGSGVPGANSYASLTEIKEYATARGLELPAQDDDIELLTIQAVDFVDSHEYQFQGDRTHLEQELAFPRTGVVLFGNEIDPESIPNQLKKAQCQATVDAYTEDLMPNLTRQAKREKVDVIEVEYAESSVATPSFTKLTSLIRPLLKSSGVVQVIRK